MPSEKAEANLESSLILWHFLGCESGNWCYIERRRPKVYMIVTIEFSFIVAALSNAKTVEYWS